VSTETPAGRLERAADELTGSESVNLGKSVMLALLGIMVTLTIKSGIDHTFAGLLPTASFLTLRQHWATHSGSDVLLGFQVIVFFVTLGRYYWGAYIYAKGGHAQRPISVLFNLGGAFLLFVGFYVVSVVIMDEDLFAPMVAVVMLVDLVWFFFVCTFDSPRDAGVQRIIHLYQLFDAITAIPIVILALTVPPRIAHSASLSLILGVGIIDIAWLWRFYLGEPDWKTRTPGFRRL
jgi:hypothetical protein